MEYLFIFILELSFLFLISKRINNKLLGFLYRLTKSRKFAFYLYSFFFFLGTFVHEMAHLLAALILFVPIGKINLFPKGFENTRVEMGSVEIAKVDFVRGFFVGVAPLVAGVAIIYLCASVFLQNGGSFIWYEMVALTYVVFTISNSMYLSSADLRSGLEFLIFIAILAVAFWFFRINPFPFIEDKLLPVTKKLTRVMLVPIVIDGVLLSLFKLKEKY